MKFISFRTLRSMCLDLIIFLIPFSVLFLALPHIIRILLPFIIGFFLYFAAKPLNRHLLSKKLPASLSAALSLLIMSLITLLFLRIVGGRIFSELRSFLENPPSFYSNTFASAGKKLSLMLDKVNMGKKSFSDTLLPMLTDAFQRILSTLAANISEFFISFAKKIPSFLIAAIASFFTAFFLLKDDKRLFSFFRSFFGDRPYKTFTKLKETLFSVASSYLKAQLLIEAVIFFVLLAGFLILKINYAFIFAALTALVDVVPILGTGTVLFPMALFQFLSGNTALAWGLVALYGAAVLTRQLCEPKILGKSLGIHPLLAVFSIYVGMKLFGIWGLIFGPFSAIFIKFLIFS